jgi:GTP-binding protein Era
MSGQEEDIGGAAPGVETTGSPESRCGFVALVGRANVGKSTLMNRLVGARVSIVSDVPQTTRFPVRGILNRPALQVVFIDTPGIHKPRYRMNEEMVRLATRVLREVDLVCDLVDASEGFGPGDRFVFDLLRQSGSRNLLVLNKVDLAPKEALLPLMDEAGRTGLFEDIVPVSALTGENSDRLEGVIVSKMPTGPPHYPADMLTDLPQRQAIAELIREQVFRQTRQEVPHATAVMIDTVERTENGLARIHATIVTDKESQKGILIGEGGRTMKGIGSAARHALEDYLGARVHLSLWVKVRKGWRDDTTLLRLIGLPLS